MDACHGAWGPGCHVWAEILVTLKSLQVGDCAYCFGDLRPLHLWGTAQGTPGIDHWGISKPPSHASLKAVGALPTSRALGTGLRQGKQVSSRRQSPGGRGSSLQMRRGSRKAKDQG